MPQNNEYDTSDEAKLLLSLVREEPLGPGLHSCRPDRLTPLAIAHKVLAPLAARVASESGIDPDWKLWAARASLSAHRDAILCARATNKTVTLLEAGGIQPIVLKGPSLALDSPRDAGDLDLLIPEDSLLQAIALLEAAGYAYRGFDRNMYIRTSEYRNWASLMRWSAQFEFLEPGTGTLVELHTAFFETARLYAENLANLRATIGQFIAASVLDPASGYRFLLLEDRVLLLAMHAGIKRSPGNEQFSLRHLVDLQRLIGAGLDWDKLAQRAFHFRVAHHLAFLLRLQETFAETWAPRGYVEGLEARLPPRMVRLLRLHQRCLRGMDGYDRLAIFRYKWLVPFVLQGTVQARLKSILVFPLFFPTLHSLANIYGLTQRSPLNFLFYVLEPFRWVFRLLRRTGKRLMPV